jgi:hypothetical protein
MSRKKTKIMTSKTLSGTTWTFNLGSMGNETVTFNANGTASFGGSKVWYWGEDIPSGQFEVQTPNPTLQNNISVIYFGHHNDGKGGGFFTNGVESGAKSILSPFTMTKL